ncbi:MAG: formylglycine-generating enzyme family protein [Thermoguttaceae bacterium]|nr:formylglycine-generating enzyme family protein [Thermoguttaceae bacterium]
MSTNSTEQFSSQTAGSLATATLFGVATNFRFAPAGSFTMGGTAADGEPRNVSLTNGFWIMESPATQELWKAVMGTNPSQFVGEKLPVDSITAADAEAFAAKLNDSGQAPEGWKFSLPTEAQWEYACRAGTATEFWFGDVCDGTQANCDGNYGFRTDAKGPWLQKTTEVGTYPANPWGLFDVHGNVWEFCSDTYGAYPKGDATDPTGATSGTRRVLRGGSWNDAAGSCRSAYRGSDAGVRAYPYNGVRLALVKA